MPAPPPAPRDLHLVGLTKRFGAFTAVEDLSLVVKEGSFFALLGPSGCGKTTTLRLIAGLEDPTTGRVLIGADDITGKPPYRRAVNTVFQSYALFPHLDVFENVAFGLRRRGIKKVRHQVTEMLELVQLGEYARRKPGQLSGGQQQRVALARALINHPRVLLLDEPLGALDLRLRRQMQIELKRIQTDVGTTFVHVTHDQEEAMIMADRIAVMNAGRVEQVGDPVGLYEAPATTFVANFLGQSNLMPATVMGRHGQDVTLDVHGAMVGLPAARCAGASTDLFVGVRPEKISITPATGSIPVDRQNQLGPGTVTDASFTGVSTQYLVRMPWGQELMVFEQNTTHGERRRLGDWVLLHWSPAHTFALDAAQRIDAGAEVEDTSPAPVGGNALSVA